MTQNLIVADALERFFNRFIALSQKLNQSLPKVEWDEEWQSLCIVKNEPDDSNQVEWRPTARPQIEAIFSSLEQGLDTVFHNDIVSYYSSFWSDGIVAMHDIGEVSLIQLWNHDDEEMLKENLLGHAFAKKRSKLALTLFIGSTADDQVICIDNSSGQVVLEKPGFNAHETIASNICEFLDSLTPSLKPYG